LRLKIDLEKLRGMSIAAPKLIREIFRVSTIEFFNYKLLF